MLKEIVEGVTAGAEKAGRSPRDVEIAPIVHCCVCEDRGLALRSVQQQLAFYGQMPFYNRIFARHGFEQEAAQIMDAALKGDQAGAADAVSERMAAECALVGTPQECRDQAEAFEKAGATYSILYPMAINGDTDRSGPAVNRSEDLKTYGFPDHAVDRVSRPRCISALRSREPMPRP